MKENIKSKIETLKESVFSSFNEINKLKERKEKKDRCMNLINNLIEQCKLIRNGNFRVSSEVLLERSLFPSEPYEHGDVKQFIREIKYGRLDLVEKMIKDDPLLVF